MKQIPNLLTGLRLILSILVFAALAALGAGRWPSGFGLERFTLAAFVFAAVTDFFDGWLARRWHDPAFPQAFPWFGTPVYFEGHVRDLERALEAIEAGPFAG